MGGVKPGSVVYDGDPSRSFGLGAEGAGDQVGIHLLSDVG